MGMGNPAGSWVRVFVGFPMGFHRLCRHVMCACWRIRMCMLARPCVWARSGVHTDTSVCVCWCICVCGHVMCACWRVHTCMPACLCMLAHLSTADDKRT